MTTRWPGRLLVVLAALTLTGCSGSDLPAQPGAARVDVGTEELQQAKARTRVADCEPGPATDGPLPAVTLPCLGGGPDVDLSTLQGPLVVNLWGSYCGPCREEMPALQQFYERYGDRVGVLGIDYQDTQPMAALELARRSGITYPLVADPGGDVNGASPISVVRGVPWFVFVDADGNVSNAPGGVDSATDLARLANEHLGTDL